MGWFPHYLHHIFFDPLSAAEKMKFEFFVGFPLLALLVFGVAIFGAWWERYTAESDD